VTERQSTKTWSGNDIRETFLRFFESKGHRRVRSSSLVPHGDPTLLFTNAGMNQFKDVFLGLEKRDYNKATTAQKCVRAGGKHNDLENVGFTKRHHTFFEMLGNFSFGDYFKKDAIAYAWELVTSKEWFGIDKAKLYTTVFGGAEVAPGTTLGVDEEARGFWLAQNVAADRVLPIPGLKDNFWAMGDTGPCGPCSEIFYDMGPEASEEGHADCKFPCDCGRYVEIWNLVFMQFNRHWDCERAGRKHTVEEIEAANRESEEKNKAVSVHECCGCRILAEPLPKPSVDTGMGLERTAAVLQHVISNYDTDLFTSLIQEAEKFCASNTTTRPDLAASFRIIADHARAATFLISDGVVPSNEGRGYVLRKIIRRALRHASIVGAPSPFLSKMANVVRENMRGAYPDLTESAKRVNQVLDSEETRFSRTVTIGLKKLEEDLDDLRGHDVNDLISEMSLPAIGFTFREYPGAKAFRLYDTYGLPRDFIEDVCRDAHFRVDWAGFDAAMEEQKKRARASWKGAAKEAASPVYSEIAGRSGSTGKDFYSATEAKDARIEAIVTPDGGGNYRGGQVRELKPGQEGDVVLDRTAIYADSGGQAADTGWLYDHSRSQLLAEVTGAYYPVAGLVAHRVVAKETLRVDDRVTVVADADRRARIMRNHTGTHLVHAALRNILGTHVRQAGSLNTDDRLRFDFTHFARVDAEELRDIEQQVNDEIRHNTEIETNITSLDDALASGALAFFGDKYPESNVRVVTIPDERAPRGFYSKELCGGTHVHRIGDIGVLKIVSEGSVAAGIRRIEAVTGIRALERYQRAVETLRSLGNLLQVGDENILMRINELAEKVASSGREIEILRRTQVLGLVPGLLEKVQTVKGTKVVAAEVEDVGREGLRQLVDSLRQKLGSGVVALGMPENGKVALIAGVTKDLTSKVHAGKLMQALAPLVGGKGGGRPDLAEAGGKDTNGLKTALQSVPSLVEALL
jgi:alanyl-tRNA synthetase